MISRTAKLLLLILPLSVCLRAEEPAPPTGQEVVASMQKFCSGLNSLACEIDLLRLARSPGKLTDRHAHFDLAFQRPNLLSVLLKDEGTVNYAWICDGKDVYTYVSGIEKYAKSPAPATLSEVLGSTEIYVVRNTLEGALLADELITGKVGDKLPGRVSAVEYVALEDVGLEKAHHLKFKRKPSDWDVWVAAGPAPLPLKVRGTLDESERREPETHVEFTVDFKRWLPGTALDPRAFQFDASSKAKRASGFLPDIPPHVLLNRPAPAATLNLADGQSRSLASHRGRDVVVMDFWGIGCVPCMGIMPKVDAVARKFAGKNVAFYAMNENDSRDDVLEFLKLKGISLTPTLRNKEANFANYKVDAIPMTFVIDKAGTIRAVHTVHSNDLGGELTELLERLIKE